MQFLLALGIERTTAGSHVLGPACLVGAEIQCALVDDAEEAAARIQAMATEHGTLRHAAHRFELFKHIVQEARVAHLAAWRRWKPGLAKAPIVSEDDGM